MANIKRQDHNTLKKLAAESSSAQLKLVKRAWEEGIQLTDRPNRIYDKMLRINTYKSTEKLVEHLIDAKKLPYSSGMFVRGACRVVMDRVNEILINLNIDGIDREKQLKSIEDDFGAVALQVGKDLVLSQNEAVISEILQRCFKTYLRSDTIEQASFHKLYMVGHASRVQAAEYELVGVPAVPQRNNAKQACVAVGVCYEFQTATCVHGPGGEKCTHKHICLWCGEGHGMRKCWKLVPLNLRKDNRKNRPKQVGKPN